MENTQGSDKITKTHREVIRSQKHTGKW